MNKVFLYLLVFFLVQCSSTFLTKQDYIPSTIALQKRDIETAIKLFPTHERNSLITSMEKAYLNLIQGKPEIDELIRYAKKIETRVRFSASRELKTFFYLETPEGYYASEHEIIWLHMLLSWGYSQRREYDKAYVEAKISSNLLSNNWSEEGRFDDPLLRVILASLWTMCGHWEEAQVDFRVAYSLDHSLTWARKLSDLPEAPVNFVLVLGGTGPEPVWDPSINVNLIRGIRALSFKSSSVRSKLILKDAKGNTLDTLSTPDSSNWYKRHLVRDNEIQDLIVDSKYGQNVLATTLKESGRSILGITGGIMLGTASIITGAGLIYLAVKCNCDDLSAGLAVGGVAIMVGGVKKGYEIAESSIETSISNVQDAIDISEDYRFVRFLPEYAWVSYSSQKLTFPLTINSKNKSSQVLISEPRNASIVSIDFLPDTVDMK